MARSFLEDIPEGRFTSATIRRMWKLVDAAKTDAQFQNLIYGLVNRGMGQRWKDYRGEIAIILGWAKKVVAYRRDPYGVELLQDVWATLDRRRADCDDFSILVAAAVEVLGSPTRFVTISNRPDKEPCHVYVQAFVNGQWTGLDAIFPESYVGWEPGAYTSKRFWTRQDVGLSGYEDKDPVEGMHMSGLGWAHPTRAYLMTSDRVARSYDYGRIRDRSLRGLGQTPWYNPYMSVPPYMKERTMLGELNTSTYVQLNGTAETVAAVTAAVGSLASSIVAERNAAETAGKDFSVANAIAGAVNKFVEMQTARYAAEMAMAKNTTEQLAIQQRQQAEKEAALKQLEAQVAAKGETGGLPGWVLPVAGGVAVLGLAAMLMKGRS